MLRRRTEGVFIREVVDDMLLLDTQSGQIHQVNQTAAFIWRNCEEVPSVERLAELLAIEFDVGQDIAVKDITDALRRFRELNLLIEA